LLDSLLQEIVDDDYADKAWVYKVPEVTH